MINGTDIVANEVRIGMGWSADDASSAAQHATLAWLADQGIIRYERIPRK